MKVDVNYVLFLRQEMNKINKVSLNDIEWYDGETKLDIDPRLVEEFKFVGLNNTNFIECGFYLEDPDATWHQRDQAFKDCNEETELGKPLIPKK